MTFLRPIFIRFTVEVTTWAVSALNYLSVHCFKRN
jgi:hypothetical protein